MPQVVLPSSSVLAIRLDDRAGLKLFGSIRIHIVVIFSIGFLAVQTLVLDVSMVGITNFWKHGLFSHLAANASTMLPFESKIVYSN